MHDPMTVAFHVRRPFPRPGQPAHSPMDKEPHLFVRKRADYPWWRPSSYFWTPFVSTGKTVYYFPALLTVWHDDAHHWRVQLDWLQMWRRRLFTRCAYCGESFPLHYGPIHIPGYAPERDDRGRAWNESETSLFHWGKCADIASVVAKKRELERLVVCKATTPLSIVQANERHLKWERKYEPYYGCYSWWRTIVLDEDEFNAHYNASCHVQRSVHECPECDGTGQRIVDVVGDVAMTAPCDACDETGHPRVEEPVPAELIP